ncbi:MAG: hypothetical protein ACRCXX_05410 [Cetobacterium sp.]|uniref:hypothetical protein n=1 Tax=Cetobacterium sp. TaxID=2071632 RepID=UPI003F3AE07B
MWTKIQEVINNNREVAIPKNFGGLLFENVTDGEFLENAAKMLIQLKLSANNRSLCEEDILNSMVDIVCNHDESYMVKTTRKISNIIENVEPDSEIHTLMTGIYENLRMYTSRYICEELCIVLDANHKHIECAIKNNSDYSTHTVNKTKYKVWGKNNIDGSITIKVLEKNIIVFEITTDSSTTSKELAHDIVNVVMATDYMNTTNEKYVLLEVRDGVVNVVNVQYIIQTLHTLISAGNMPHISGGFIVRTFYDFKRILPRAQTFKLRKILENYKLISNMIKNSHTDCHIIDLDGNNVKLLLTKENDIYNILINNSAYVPPFMNLRNFSVNISFDKASINKAIDVTNVIVTTYGKKLADNSKIILRNGFLV